MNKCVKIVVTGAAGQIGYALLFRLASGEAFGHNTAIELRLLELPSAVSRLDGIRMELEDCGFPLLKNVICTSDANIAMKDVNWALLVGAVPRKAGMERSDLLESNGAVFVKQGQALNKNAAEDVKILVVGNPCNTNALITLHNAPDISKDHFFAMTMLDETRAKAQLALRAQVDVANIYNMNIWGNHSATMFPDFYHAKIGDKKVIDVITDCDWLQNNFMQTVQQRGSTIIKARGLSSAASAAQAIISTIRNVENETPHGETFSLAKYSQGEYGVDMGLMFSFPCYTQKGVLKTVMQLEHNEFAQQRIAITLNELRKEREIVTKLKLL